MIWGRSQTGGASPKRTLTGQGLDLIQRPILSNEAVRIYNFRQVIDLDKLIGVFSVLGFRIGEEMIIDICRP